MWNRWLSVSSQQRTANGKRTVSRVFNGQASVAKLGKNLQTTDVWPRQQWKRPHVLRRQAWAESDGKLPAPY